MQFVVITYMYYGIEYHLLTYMFRADASIKHNLNALFLLAIQHKFLNLKPFLSTVLIVTVYKEMLRRDQ